MTTKPSEWGCKQSTVLENRQNTASQADSKFTQSTSQRERALLFAAMSNASELGVNVLTGGGKDA